MATAIRKIVANDDLSELERKRVRPGKKRVHDIAGANLVKGKHEEVRLLFGCSCCGTKEARRKRNNLTDK